MAQKTRLVSLSTPNGKNLVFGGRDFQLIAGPCSIESQIHLQETAEGVARLGAGALRGGIFKMRTSPETFQGLGEEAFAFVDEVKRRVGLPLVAEITDARQIAELSRHVDMFQVGSRNMYNYTLLNELGLQPKPVLLKRGFSATVDEWVKAAAYIERGGNRQIILCERGIRSFEPSTRNTLDLNSVAYIKAHTDFPVLVDPSHGTGRSELVTPMSLAAAAAGADGLIVEVHPRPAEALSDGFQALDLASFATLTGVLRPLLRAIGRELPSAVSHRPEPALFAEPLV